MFSFLAPRHQSFQFVMIRAIPGRAAGCAGVPGTGCRLHAAWLDFVRARWNAAPQPSDSAALRIAGPPFPVAEHVTSESIGFSAAFTAAQTGTLAFY